VLEHDILEDSLDALGPPPPRQRIVDLLEKAEPRILFRLPTRSGGR